jgi:hypothetical protein
MVGVYFLFVSRMFRDFPLYAEIMKGRTHSVTKPDVAVNQDEEPSPMELAAGHWKPIFGIVSNPRLISQAVARNYLLICDG